MYQLGQYERRVNEFAEHDQALGLRQELGILRMMLEKLLERCAKDAGEDQLILQMNPISDMVTKINRLVLDCKKLEEFSGGYLTKAQVLVLAQEMINIFAEYVTPEQLAEVASRITNVVETESYAKLVDESS